MKIFSLLLIGFFLWGCNTVSKKDPNKAMDDTARMANPPFTTTTPVPVKLTAGEIPASLTINGKIQEAWKWTDNLGENILITSYVAPYDDKGKNEYGEEGQTAEIHAVHYAKKDGDYVQVWKIDEKEKSCPFDITCGFIPGSATITDVDKDAVAEVKLQYSLACRSDVSPALMKLVMYENGVQYTLKGMMWLPYSPELKFTVTEKDVNLEGSPKLKDETEEMLRTFGRYETEKEFAAAPPQFLAYARGEWLKYVKEKMGE